MRCDEGQGDVQRWCVSCRSCVKPTDSVQGAIYVKAADVANMLRFRSEHNGLCPAEVADNAAAAKMALLP